MKPNVCWFRTDLRVHDNLALAAAAANGPVIGLYIATPQQWQSHDDAPIKLDFWRRQLLLLQDSLAEHDIPLVCCETPDYNAIPAVIEEIIDTWGAGGIYFNREYPLNESRRDAAVTFVCDELGVPVHAFDDSVLMKPGSILNNSGEPFRVFTPFSRKARQIIGPMDQSASALPAKAGAGQPAKLKTQRPLSSLSWPKAHDHWASLWPAGEKEARKRLEDFCQHRITAYKDQRDLPAVDGTSKLSAWLNAGIISIRECWRTASAWNDGNGVETWKNELLWREFYKHIMVHYPHVSMARPFRDDYGHVPWRDDEEQFRAWCEGCTGIPLVDAAMRQLRETGWMHNRLRMVTAMFLSKNLLIDWRMGEQWFMQHLVDGDFSANNGGWQWSASTGTDAVPYFRVFNATTQSRRFDANGDFIRQFVPELASLDNKAIHEPGAARPANYPAPLVDLKATRARALEAFKR